MERELIYVGDPMCSWCWGMAPVIERLDAEIDLPLRLVLGGLRPGATDPMDGRSARVVEHHWHEVARRTGQPFDHSFFERSGFVYDTEPPSRAVVAMREIDPKQALPFFTRIQRAFYAENRDVTDDATLLELAADWPVDQSRFEDLLSSEETLQHTREDFRLARSMGVTGFPSVLLRQGSVAYPVTFGYAPFDEVRERIEQWLARIGPSGQACAPGEIC